MLCYPADMSNNVKGVVFLAIFNDVTLTNRQVIRMEAAQEWRAERSGFDRGAVTETAPCAFPKTLIQVDLESPSKQIASRGGQIIASRDTTITHTIYSDRTTCDSRARQ